MRIILTIFLFFISSDNYAQGIRSRVIEGINKQETGIEKSAPLIKPVISVPTDEGGNFFLDNNKAVSVAVSFPDGAISYSLRPLEIGLFFENIFNVKVNEPQLATESRLKIDSPVCLRLAVFF